MLILLTQGGGVQNLGKVTDVILECSLNYKTLFLSHQHVYEEEKLKSDFKFNQLHRTTSNLQGLSVWNDFSTAIQSLLRVLQILSPVFSPYQTTRLATRELD